jgi:hypothetical protein
LPGRIQVRLDPRKQSLSDQNTFAAAESRDKARTLMQSHQATCQTICLVRATCACGLKGGSLVQV